MKREDPLEERLRRLEWRPLPESWREEILVAAEDDRRPAAGRAGLLQRVKPLLNELLWPSPRAWAGLAAVWVALLAANRIFAPRRSWADGKENGRSPNVSPGTPAHKAGRVIKPSTHNS